MTRTPNGPTVCALEDAIWSLARACGLDYLLRQIFDAVADVVRSAVDRSQRRADALAAAEREVAS